MTAETRAVLLLVGLIAFTFLGALVMLKLEDPHEKILIKKQMKRDNTARIQLANQLFESAHKAKDASKWLKPALKAIAKFETTTEDETVEMWNFWSSVFYCTTVYTTIGYGNVYPRTNAGKAFTMGYAIVGIPLCLVCLAQLGLVLTKLIKRLVRGMAPSVTDSEEFDFSLQGAIAVSVLYLAVVSAVWQNIEPTWSRIDTFYFMFISTSTIGFGDLVPSSNTHFLAASIIMFGGLALVALLLNLLASRIEGGITAIGEALNPPKKKPEGGDGGAKALTEEEVAWVYGRQPNDWRSSSGE